MSYLDGILYTGTTICHTWTAYSTQVQLYVIPGRPTLHRYNYMSYLDGLLYTGTIIHRSYLDSRDREQFSNGLNSMFLGGYICRQCHTEQHFKPAEVKKHLRLTPRIFCVQMIIGSTLGFRYLKVIQEISNKNISKSLHL